MSSIEDIVRLYRTNEINEEELRQIRNRLKSDEIFRCDFFREKDFQDTMSCSFDTQSYHKDVKVLLSIKRHRNRLRVRKFLRYSAAASVIFILGLVASIILQKSPYDQSKIYYADNKDILECILPDSTHVWLNAGGTLAYKYNDGKRLVQMKGEAFFNVHKDKSHPFLVSSGDQTVEVLGTQFNVRAYPTDNIIETVLEEGSIKLHIKGRSIRMKPSEKIIYDIEANTISLEPISKGAYNKWMNGIYHFDRSTLENILCVMESWYDIEIDRGSTNLPNVSFTGSLNHERGLQSFINILENVLPVHFIPIKTSGRIGYRIQLKENQN
ncbi:FecR family protein [Halosquirtibacter xylanolyticus]|uniref:FecR family protein n=1 Tax=Halosquirtibacter xylanolyticus TaxID=3374599 RepID=UPI0037490D02|nr:FecR family protein [Prolixibacteraceae bacterium]